MRIPELALGTLALDRLPSILGGRMPAGPARAGADPSDFVDTEGRRWTATRVAEVVETWTLWADDRPLLWWRRLGPGGVLSHRDGAQFRWRRSVVEPLTAAPSPLDIPSGYGATECSELVAIAGAP